MQFCLEHFQQFLSRLITLYITPKQAVKAGGERDAVLQSGPLVSEDCQHSDHMEQCSGSGLVQRDCVAAFTAACQLCLESSSFPVYIAEGNLKSSPTREEQFGKCLKFSVIKTMAKPFLTVLTKFNDFCVSVEMKDSTVENNSIWLLSFF